jgi:hypothetical protein
MERVPHVGFAALTLVIVTTPGRAAFDLPYRVASSPIIIFGKVTAIEDGVVRVPIFDDPKNKGDFRVAVVKIEEALAGAKDMKEIKVGFLPSKPALNPKEPVPTMTGAPFVLTKGQEVCLFLQPHSSGKFYVPPLSSSRLLEKPKKKPDAFEKDYALVKRCVNLLDDADKGLKSKGAEDRLLTALMLLAKYRDPELAGKAGAKEEAIDADESKLILQALAEFVGTGFPDNSKKYPELSRQMDWQFTALDLSSRLGCGEKDGLEFPKDRNKSFEEAKKWLQDNVEKYRIKRYVIESTDKK